MGAYRSTLVFLDVFLMMILFHKAFGCGGLRYNGSTCIEVQVTPISDASDIASWNEANENCRSRGYELVSIHTEDKLHAINRYIVNITTEVKFYIGLSRAAGLDRSNDNNWKWSSGLALSISNWESSAEPNSENANCAGVYLNRGKFVDLRCDTENGVVGIGQTYIYEYPIPKDWCDNVNCNSGTCVSANGTYSCKCFTDFRGQFCEFEIDWCENVDCGNGTCYSRNGTHSCQCFSDYRGNACIIKIDWCENVDCGNGICYSRNGTHLCQCYSGYHGETCNIKIDWCENIDCGNGTCYSRNGTHSCQCFNGYSGEFCDIEYCVAEDVEDSGTLYSFSDTSLGETTTSLQLCPIYSKRGNLPMANRTCNQYTDGVRWGDIVVLDCGQDNTTDNLLKLSKVEVTEENIESVANALEVLTSNTSNMKDFEDTVIHSAQILENIVSMNSSSTSVTTAIVDSVNNLLEIVDEVEDTLETRRASSSTVMSLEDQMETIASADLTITVNRKNVAVTVARVDSIEIESNGLVYVSFLKASDTPSLIYSNTSSDIDVIDVDTSLQLPPEVASAMKTSVIFTIYQQPSIFRTDHDQKELASKVISAKILKKEIRDLKDPVIGIFKPTVMNGSEIECVFWDFELENGIGNWSTDGCRFDAINDGRVVCHCDHLTNFAVLMDFHGQHELKNDPKYKSLDIISTVGCIVSVVALALTIFIQVYAKRTSRSRDQHLIRPKLVLINLSIALCMLYLVFALGIERTATKRICSIVAVLMHYFTVSSISWMTVQAVNIYLSLVMVFPTYISKFRLKAYTLGWGLPLVVVVISLIIDAESYSNEHYCFLTPGPILYYGNILVIGVLYFINLIIFIIVIHRILLRSRTPIIQKIVENKSRLRETKDQVTTAIGLSILLGLTWIFGFGDIERPSSSKLKFTMHLLFSVFNTLQGLFIFLFYAVRTGDFKRCARSCFHFGSCCSRSSRGCFHVNFSAGQSRSTSAEQTLYAMNTGKLSMELCKENILSN